VYEVIRYLQSEIFTPFFYVVGDNDYVAVMDDLAAKGLIIIYTSHYCKADRQPNLDAMFKDIESQGSKLVVGFGEYLALSGERDTYNWLAKLQYHNLKGSKAVILLRGDGLYSTVKTLQKNDLRFDAKFVCYSVDTTVGLSLTCIPKSLTILSACEGLRGILAAFEVGQRSVVAITANEFADASMEIRSISTAYDGIKYLVPTFTLTSDCGNDENWNELLSALIAEKGSIDRVFASYHLPEDLAQEFGTFIKGNAFVNWLYFIALKMSISDIGNSYLHRVLEKTVCLDKLKNNVLNEITEVSHRDVVFDILYSERKKIIENFDEHDVADFVNNNRVNIAESLFRLTDVKRSERQEFVALFSILDKNSVAKRVETAYPALSDYLSPYTFTDPKLSDELRKLLTDYFEDYKWQKVLNKIDESFVSKVEGLANNRQYPFMRSRAEIFNVIDKDGAFLYWLDALGVEFLGYIQKACKKLGLSIAIHIGRAELPTITSKNRDFFDNWDESSRINDKSLDEVKHKDNGGYNYRGNCLPIHIERELEVIADSLSKISTFLALRKYRKVLLVSDHGASRLSVIKEQDEKYETDTKGKHGGRCCAVFKPYDLPFATEENGFLVLANYGRFRGSRAANVEVHGGATLEEVVVPVIEISLAKPNIVVKLVNETVYADHKNYVELELYSNSKLRNVRVTIRGQTYEAVRIGDNHLRIVTDIKRAGTYQADVFDGDDLVGSLTFIAQGGSGKIDNAFNNLF